MFKQKVLRLTIPVMFVSTTLMSFMECTIILFAFSQFSLLGDNFVFSIQHVEICLVFVSAINSAIKLGFCYSYSANSFTRRTACACICAFFYCLIMLITRGYWLSEHSDILEDLSFKLLITDKGLMSSIAICILVPSFINWIMFELGKTYCISIATRAIQTAEREIILMNHSNESRFGWDGSDNKSSYFINQRQISAIRQSINGTKLLELKIYLNWFVKYTLESRFSSRFNFTTLVSYLKTLTHGVVRNVSITAVGGVRKLLTLDLFNYHVGLQHFSNFISERVERKKFRKYLLAARQGDIRMQMFFYLLLFASNYAVGVLTDQFGYNYMLDTTVPYKLFGLLVIIYVLSFQSLSRHSRLLMLAFGVCSSLVTLIMVIFSHNRFDMNLIDFVTSRLWFTSLLETVDSLCLVSVHLIIRVLR